MTSRLADVVARSRVAQGACTDAVFLEDRPSVLDRLFPQGVRQHDRIDDNGAAQPEAGVPGPSGAGPVRGGRLRPGTWQGTALVESDGPREREIIVDARG